jgi:eukaryotic-like serine/threonine-protein kinase
MTDPALVKRLFVAALDLPKEARGEYLDGACQGDAELRREVEGLLGALSGQPVLDAGTLGIGSPERIPLPLEEGPGTRINQYKLLQKIGEGGFGMVFMAEQERPVRRRVALKIIKLGMETRQVIARFEQERQALAMMDHPNIAKVLDAGATDTGRPYFVMELVHGVPITEYSDTQHLTARARLELFVPVCHAIQHAHQKGIIHRDIKPGNVLVTLHDGKPVPKVIDFGVAKATNQRLTEKTLFTEFKTIIGTPVYMSPEQAEMSGLDIDTRTDLYSLGVLLYELLTGTTPFDQKSLLAAGFAEMQRIIREVEPPKPSTRLSTLAGALSTVAASRGTEPAKLSRTVKGDLDWIVMRCLEKDRGRRYETANELAADVERHLNGDPIIAAPPSARYRFRKFVRRHRVGVIAGAAIAAALILGVIGITVGMLWAFREARVARSQRDKAEMISGFMSDTLSGVGPSVARGRDTTMLREMMDEAAKKIEEGALTAVPEAEVELRHTIGLTYRKLAAYEAAERMVGPAVDLSRKVYGAESEWTALLLTEHAALMHERGKGEESLAKAEEALAIRRRLSREDQWGVVDSLNLIGLILVNLSRAEEALPRFEATLEMAQRLAKGDHSKVAMVLNNFAQCLLNLQRPQEALRKFESVLAMTQRLAQGDDPDVAVALHNVGDCLSSLGRFDEALLRYESALTMYRRLYKDDHPNTASAIADIASCLQPLGRPGEALPLYEEALAMFQRFYKGGHPLIARRLSDQASCLAELGRHSEAVAILLRSLDMYRKFIGTDNQGAVLCLNRLALCQEILGRIDDSIERRREVLAILRRRFPSGSPDLSAALTFLGQALLKAGTPAAAAEAEKVLREGVALRRRLFPETHPQKWLIQNAASLLGESLVAEAADPTLESETRLARLVEAEPLLIEAYQKLKDDPAVPPPAVIGADRKLEALERIVRLHEVWDQVEPGKGHDQRAAEWRAKRG